MLYEGKIWVGSCDSGPVCLLPAMANRHGLIAGATGTGKTVSLKVLAEGFSDLGVPVFLSDVKSDLSGMVRPGEGGEKIDLRLEKCGVPRDRWSYHAYPSVFWDVYGEQGHPIRATVQAMGPLLMSRMLSLNETQSGVMNILFRVASREGYDLVDLRDLKQLLIHLGEHAREYTLEYGNVSLASVGAIQRAVAVLEDQGGDAFFGEPAIDISDWIAQDPESGKGRINMLAADRLLNSPTMYSTFLLWMLTRLYDLLPERGDAEKPVIVFFFDEAHLLFNNCSKALMEKIEQVVRLVRSKGVGVYFITQSPADIPMTVLGQLGNRIQHALRAYTPLDQKAVKVAAQTFRPNPSFDTEDAITTLKTGEALVSFLDASGAPCVVERSTILPPQSFLGAVSSQIRSQVIATSPLAGVYDTLVPRVGAYELLRQKELQERPVVYYIPPQPVQPIPSPTTPLAAQVSTVQTDMGQKFKVFDPVSGQYVEKEIPTMTQVQEPVQPQIQAQPVQQPVVQASQPVYQPAPQPVYQDAQPVYQAAPQPVYQEAQPVYQPAPQPVYQEAQPAVQASQPVYQDAQPVYQAAPQAIAPVQQAVPTIQVQPQVQKMAVMVLDPTTGQYVQQIMDMVQDPATGNYVPATVAMDPKTLAAQQKAAAAAEKEAARAAKEQEAAERRARNDALREEAAERARRNDSVAGRVKNTAISTATRQVVSSLTKNVTKAIEGLFDGDKKK